MIRLKTQSKYKKGTGEMAHCLRVLAALTEDPSQLPAPMWGGSQLHVTPTPGDPTPSSELHSETHTPIWNKTQKSITDSILCNLPAYFSFKIRYWELQVDKMNLLYVTGELISY